QELITALQQERPPQAQLLSQAGMTLVAAAMLAGDLGQAQKALLAIAPKTLSDADRQQFTELRDLLADAHREAFTKAFKADTTDSTGAKNKGEPAAHEARSLLELLQKTDPGNSTAIAETRLKLANAQLLGGHYHDAEKTLAGINERQMVPELK